jgi:hypothetical protein
VAIRFIANLLEEKWIVSFQAAVGQLGKLEHDFDPLAYDLHPAEQILEILE